MLWKKKKKNKKNYENPLPSLSLLCVWWKVSYDDEDAVCCCVRVSECDCEEEESVSSNANPNPKSNTNTTSFCGAPQPPNTLIVFFLRLFRPVSRWPPSLLLQTSPSFQGTSLSLSLYIYIYSKLDYLPKNLFTMCAAFVFLLWNSFYVVKCSYYGDNFVIINGKCTGWRLKVKVI